MIGFEFGSVESNDSTRDMALLFFPFVIVCRICLVAQLAGGVRRDRLETVVEERHDAAMVADGEDRRGVRDVRVDLRGRIRVLAVAHDMGLVLSGAGVANDVSQE